MFTLLVLFSAAWAGTSVWATADVDALRWPDAAVVSFKVQKGDTLELLVTDGAKLRVRKGTEFGWIDAASTTNVEPAPAADENSLPTLGTTGGAPAVPAAPAPTEGAAPVAPAP